MSPSIIRHRLTLATTFAFLLTLSLPIMTQAQSNSPFKSTGNSSLNTLATATPITISSTTGWQQTGFTVQQGAKFTISYTPTSGTWTVDVNNFPHVLPDGYSWSIDQKIYQGCKYDSSLRYATLLGQIGNSPDFTVGVGGVFTASQSGILSLRINDQDGCLADNAGSITLYITNAAVFGGTWMSPQSPTQFTARGNTFYFAAYVFGGSAGVAHVNFTAEVGNTWFIACQAFSPVSGTTAVYQCTWDLKDKNGNYVPNGTPIKVSFDVYDKAGKVAYAPNGVHQGTVDRTAQWCECVIYIENDYGFSDPTSICCGVNGYAKDMGLYLQDRRFRQVASPQVGAVIIFQPQFGSGIDQTAGHVGIISSVQAVGNNWAIKVEGSHQITSPVYTKANCTNVSNISFAQYPQSDPYVSYWVRY